MQYPVPRMKGCSLFSFITTWVIFHLSSLTNSDKDVCYYTVIPTLQVSRLTFLFVRGEENTVVWESIGFLDLISRVLFLFLSPFPTWLFYCLCLQRTDQFPKTIMLLYFKSFSSLLTLFIFISLVIYNKRNLSYWRRHTLRERFILLLWNLTPLMSYLHSIGLSKYIGV